MALVLPTQRESPGRKRLFEIATPDLYQVNAFRVLGLPTHAAGADVRKREKRMRRMQRLGKAAGFDGGYMPLSVPPDEDDVRQAMQRLQDPLARLFDEFFWFWPRQQGAGDDALELLGRKRVQDAHQLWLSRESSELVSMHNLAVLYHVSALDFEYRLDKKPLDEKDDKTRIGCWRRAYNRWHKLVKDDSFWARVRERIHELDDPQLTAELAREIREALSEVILLINARLAVKAAEADRGAQASQHVQIMRESQFDQVLISDSLRECLKPIRHRLGNLCEDAESKADADPSSADVVTRELLQEAKPLLKTIDMMLPAGDSLREGAHDEVALAALRCQISYGNETSDWKESLQLLELALKNIDPSASMRTRIEENRDIVKNNLQHGLCFFCGERQASNDCAVKRPMYGNVRKEASGWNSYRVKWQHAEIAVPRCAECKKHHSRVDNSIGGGCVIGALAGALGFLSILAMGPGGACVGIVLALIGAVIGAFVGNQTALSQTPYKMKPDTDVEDFERIKELQKQGWKFGTQPSEEEQKAAPTEGAAGLLGSLLGGGRGSGGSWERSCTNCGRSSYTLHAHGECPYCGIRG